MIIQFRLKLDKFYCIGVINQQNKIFLMSWQIDILKWIITGLIGKKSCKKQKKKCSKEKAAEYYAQNKEAIKEKSRECYKNLS